MGQSVSRILHRIDGRWGGWRDFTNIFIISQLILGVGGWGGVVATYFSRCPGFRVNLSEYINEITDGRAKRTVTGD